MGTAGNRENCKVGCRHKHRKLGSKPGSLSGFVDSGLFRRLRLVFFLAHRCLTPATPAGPGGDEFTAHPGQLAKPHPGFSMICNVSLCSGGLGRAGAGKVLAAKPVEARYKPGMSGL